MELCESDLTKFIKDKNNELIDEKVIYIFLKDISYGLKEIHSKNVIHRDLKPGNILVGRDKKFKIADFGISKYNNQTLTSKWGTQEYSAPEYLIENNEGKISYDNKIDLWSLGRIMCDLCKCKSIPSIHNLYNNIIKINNNYDKKLENLIKLLLKKDPKDRIDLKKAIIEINKLESECHSQSENLDKLSKEILERKKENEIKFNIEIGDDDINKDIYFLDGGESHKNLKELNQDNTELYFYNKNNRIQKFKYIFQKCFRPEYKGNYEILLKLKDKLSDASNMFSNCLKLNSIDLTFFDTTNIVNMSSMLACTKLINIDLSTCNTINVKNMNNMFADCENLEQLDLSSFNTSKVEDMSYMFSGCKKLKYINLKSFNTQNVTNMKYMFNYCENLETIDLLSFKIF